MRILGFFLYQLYGEKPLTLILIVQVLDESSSVSDFSAGSPTTVNPTHPVPCQVERALRGWTRVVTVAVCVAYYGEVTTLAWGGHYFAGT